MSQSHSFSFENLCLEVCQTHTRRLNLETISRWARSDQEKGLDVLKNDPRQGGEHGQRCLKASELDKLSKLLEQEAMPGAEVGRRWTIKAIRALIGSGEKVTPLAGDQSKVYLEGTVAQRWNPVGHRPLNADGARGKAAGIIYSALRLGTGGEVFPFLIDLQDSEATVCRLEQALKSCPRWKIVL